MTRQVISTGSAANDGTGDTLRSASQKINENFVELYQRLGGDSDILSGQISIEDSAVVFEGASTNDFETRLVVADPTADRVVRVPDADGYVVLDNATQTLSAKTLTSPTIYNPIVQQAIRDSAGVELVEFQKTASAVNHVKIINQATGQSPVIEAVGDDTNINLRLLSTGEGSISLSKAAFAAQTITADGAASREASYIICDKGSALAVDLESGVTIGEYKIFTNKGAGTATITPQDSTGGIPIFAQGTDVTIPQYAAAQFVWDGDNWYLVSRDGESDGTTIDGQQFISLSTIKSVVAGADSYGTFQTAIAAL